MSQLNMEDHVSRETDALDALEDARADLETYQLGVRTAVVVLVLSVASILTGAWIQADYLTVAFCVLGGSGAPLAVGFGWLWFWYNHTTSGSYGRSSTNSPAKRLRLAERYYRTLISE